MNLNPRRPEDPEINITSLIDVVLLLLVFFMVSTSFVHEADIKLELPQSSAKPAPGAEKGLVVTVDAQGNYYVNDKALVNSRPETLKRALEKEAGDQRGVPLTIRADARTTHQSVVTVMDVAGKLGFVHISIVTTKREKN
ncbi:MAG: biopolymer transporter ExbD [Gammaproteobacteria bacterium]|jgi:biopolymer transport protein ExbD